MRWQKWPSGMYFRMLPGFSFDPLDHVSLIIHGGDVLIIVIWARRGEGGRRFPLFPTAFRFLFSSPKLYWKKSWPTPKRTRQFRFFFVGVLSITRASGGKHWVTAWRIVETCPTFRFIQWRDWNRRERRHSLVRCFTTAGTGCAQSRQKKRREKSDDIDYT